MRRGALVALCDRKAPGALVAVAVAIAVAAAPAAAAGPQASIADIEDEVMCPVCGTLLELSSSPQAQRQRAFINAMIAAGKTKVEIEDALVAEYGTEVLALPGGSGFDLSAYLVPAIAFLVAAAALGAGVRRWRRAPNPPGSKPAGPGPQGEDAERLEADLGRYDL